VREKEGKKEIPMEPIRCRGGGEKEEEEVVLEKETGMKGEKKGRKAFGRCCVLDLARRETREGSIVSGIGGQIKDAKKRRRRVTARKEE